MPAPAGRLPRHGAGSKASSWPRLSASFVAVAAALIVAAGLAGWAGRSATAPTRAAAPAPTRSIDLGPVTMSAPGAWAPARAPAEVPEQGPRAATYAPVPGLTARAVLSLTPFDDRKLLTAGLQPLAGTAPPRRATLAGLPAWRYRALELANGRMAQATVAPTAAGNLTVVCVAPTATWSGAAGCADDLAGASVKRASPPVPSRTLAFRRQLSTVLDRLGGRRAALRARLHGATTPRGQARFATRLAVAYERAAAALAPRAAGTGAPQEVVRVLKTTARSYQRLSAAAAGGRPARYRAARAAIRRSDLALVQAAARVR